MSYVDTNYYKNTYKGTTIPDAELDSYLQRASDNVDQLTFFRIEQKGGIGELTVFQTDKVKKAVCSQADHLYSVKDLPDEVQSYSIEGTSVSFKPDADRRHSKACLDYLNATGLRYRGL